MRKLFLLATVVLASVGLYGQSTYRSKLSVKPGKGVTVGGTVECDGRPVPGVVVSDGYEVTKTDKKGAYYLKSQKLNPQVFISVPSGYEVWREDAVPQFWADFELPADKFERHDFRLIKRDNSRHALLLIADPQLANQRNDVSIFSDEYVPLLRKDAEYFEARGIPVYTINLGDAVWDTYWYGHDYSIADFRKTLEDADYPTAMYSVMGNHDNDPATPCDDNTDFNASLPYQKAFGPRYYSHNIGNVHYIFLDNIHYINTPSEKPVYANLRANRNYTEDFTPEQLEWLRKDLAEVSYDTPLIVAMHGPMFRWKKFDDNKKWTSIGEDVRVRTDDKSTRELLSILKPYKTVHTVCGHSHKENLVRLPEDFQNLTEHNVSGICGSFWRTRATGLKNLCPDGTPVGYDIFTIDGDSIGWEHRTFEYDPERQFYAWDMNEVKRYFRENNDMHAFRNMYPAWTDYSSLPDNYVYVNLWAWDPAGELTITENGKELEVEMVKDENPLYTAASVVRNTVWINVWDKKAYKKPQKFQLFRAKASTADAPLEITWKDYFGKEYKSTLNRSAPFTLETSSL